MPSLNGTATTRDGIQIGFTVSGATDGAPRVALIHSLAMDRRFWQPVAEALAPHAAVLTYDCRGHGRSDRPEGPYTVEGFARDLIDVLDHLGWDEAVVAGASMGGSVALAFAADHPERTTALGLIDTTAWYGPKAPEQWSERAERAAEKGLAALVEFQKTRWFTDGFRTRRPDVVEQCVEVFLANDTAAYGASCQMLGALDLRDALGGLEMPAAVVVGEEDYATPPAMAEVLHRGIAGSTLTVLDGARHLTPLEHPERIAGELTRLIERAAS